MKTMHLLWISLLTISSSCTKNLYIAEAPVITDQTEAKMLSVNGGAFMVQDEGGFSASVSYSLNDTWIIGCHGITTGEKHVNNDGLHYSNSKHVIALAGLSDWVYYPVTDKASLSLLLNTDIGNVARRYSTTPHHNQYGNYLRLTLQPQLAHYGRIAHVAMGVRTGIADVRGLNWNRIDSKNNLLIVDPYFAYGLGSKKLRLSLVWSRALKVPAFDNQTTTLSIHWGFTFGVKANEKPMDKY
jgi:hypothetical protein